MSVILRYACRFPTSQVGGLTYGKDSMFGVGVALKYDKGVSSEETYCHDLEDETPVYLLKRRLNAQNTGKTGEKRLTGGEIKQCEGYQFTLENWRLCV